MAKRRRLQKPGQEEEEGQEEQGLTGGENTLLAWGRLQRQEVRFLTEIVDDFRRFVDEIWLF